jgi:uncharacterized protein (DUF169 family)
MLDTKSAVERIESHVRPATFPVAVRLLEPDEPIPDKARRPQRDLGVQIATCQGVTMARRYGWTVALTRDDIGCPLTKVAFGLEPEPPYFAEGHCCAGMYTSSPEAGAKTESHTHHFPHGKYAAILMGPATRVSFEPHVVIIYATPAQVLRLTTGALWKRGGALHSSFTGRIDCSDEIIRTMATNECQVILPCYGDRVFGQTNDDEMAFAFPWSKVEELLEGLEGTHKGGVRFPIPSFVRYAGDFPPSYRKLDEIWAAEKREG